MDPQTVRDFVARDWADAAASKRDYWARRFRGEGWQPVWTAAQGLLEHARRIRPDFPTTHDREHDRLHHAALRARLDRAAHAFPRR
jgi:hypothetical protein